MLFFPDSHSSPSTTFRIVVCVLVSDSERCTVETLSRDILQRLFSSAYYMYTLSHPPTPPNYYLLVFTSSLSCQTFYSIFQWGLLITFIELIKNPRYSFWRRNFTRCAPELERVFESVARSCMGPTASATMLQQQLGQVQSTGSESKAAVR